MKGIEPITFFKVGIFTMGIIAVVNSLLYIQNIKNHTFLSSIGALAGIFFNFAMCAFFIYLYNTNKVSVETESVEGDIDEVIKSLKSEGVKKST